MYLRTRETFDNGDPGTPTSSWMGMPRSLRLVPGISRPKHWLITSHDITQACWLTVQFLQIFLRCRLVRMNPCHFSHRWTFRSTRNPLPVPYDIPQNHFHCHNHVNLYATRPSFLAQCPRIEYKPTSTYKLHRGDGNGSGVVCQFVNLGKLEVNAITLVSLWNVCRRVTEKGISYHRSWKNGVTFGEGRYLNLLTENRPSS